MSAPAPSWYDVLGVEASATSEEIRAAWKAAIAELEPTDRRFRVLNQAAEVLLDDQARAEYDEARRSERSEPAEPTVVEEPAERASRDQVSHAEAAPEPVAVEAPVAERISASLGWVLTLAVLGVAALGLVIACAVVATRPTVADQSAATEDRAREAVGAAGPAVEAILSYDYRDLEGSQSSAHEFMTERYREAEYDPFFDSVVRPGAEETKTVVDADVLLAALVRPTEDRVQVLVYVNRPRTNAGAAEPEVFRDQVTVTMELVDGEWLVDAVDTTPLQAG